MYLENITVGNTNSTLNNIIETFDKHPWIVPILVLIVSAITAYIKNLFGLKIKIKKLFDIIKQFKVFFRLLHRLWIICGENSQNYRSMIEFRPSRGSIRGENSNISPYMEFSFSISNFSIFDFESNSISMDVVYNNNILKTLTNADMELSHMKIHHQGYNANHVRIQPLSNHFIDMLKKIKAEGIERSVTIELQNLKIDFIGDREFRKSWHNGFKLEISMESIRVTL
jgi:hypothetical protein